MMIYYNYTHIEMRESLREELYNKMDSKLKWALSTKRQIREIMLAQTMPNFGKTHISIA